MSQQSQRRVVPVGVCVLPSPAKNTSRTVVYPEYIFEILDHAGLCYTRIDWTELAARLDGLHVLLTVGEGAPEENVGAKLRTWAEQGGRWLSVGGVLGLSDLFGVEVEKAAFSSWGGGVSNLGEGYLRPLETSHPTLDHLVIPLHYYNGLPARAAGAQVLAGIYDAHQRDTERVGLCVSKVGAGAAMLLAPDLTGAVVRIQQGMPVLRDGISAPDGTAPVTDAYLKSDDGCVLDWIFDRQPLPDVPGLSGFLQPIADQWRELLLRALFHLATEAGVALAVLWMYPRNLPWLAHMSHDTDGNEAHKCTMLLDALQRADIRSTWCTILPGYSAEQTAAIRNAGHELAMHYDTVTPPLQFTEAEFDRQWRGLVELFGGEKPVTNKNHYLRWEGDVDLLEWCEARGIQLDQTKGASKTGEAGFNFGTCHLHFPLRADGSTIDVLELPTPTQDLRVFGPPEIAGHILRAAKRHHGIMHLLFHPAHMDKPGVIDALVDAVQLAKDAGAEWWTGAQLNDWERARRAARWSLNGGEVSLSNAEALPGATMLVLGSPSDAGEQVTRWGFAWSSSVRDIAAGENVTIEDAQ